MLKVSVIIPFNNVEAYIAQCLESVKNQTLKDIEIILINDASSDNSAAIAKKYAVSDSRFKIITLDKRMGQGFARNRGIEAAKGVYIGFVDSDDFIEPDMFELLYKRAMEDDTDITMALAAEYDDLNSKYIKSDYYSLSILEKFGSSVFSAADTKDEILDINAALWNKIYKRKYLLDTGEKMPEGFIYEDLPFFFGSYLPAERINIVWKVLYSYRINRRNSTMQQFNNKILDRPPMVSLSYEKLNAADFLSDKKKQIQGWIINDLFHRYVLLKENYHREFFFLMKKVFRALEIENPKDDYWKKVYHFEGYLMVMNNTFEDFSRKIFNKYLDIHEIENRLRSEFISNIEMDRRSKLFYDDLSKTYNYTDKKSKEAEYAAAETAYDKLSGIYGDLCRDIKDLSFVINCNYEEAKKDTGSLKDFSNSLSEKLETFKQTFEYSLASLRNTMFEISEKQMKPSLKEIEASNSMLLNKLKAVSSDAEALYSEQKICIKSLKEEFSALLEEQKKDNEAQTALLKDSMQQMISELKEEMKSPIQKFFERNRREGK